MNGGMNANGQSMNPNVNMNPNMNMNPNANINMNPGANQYTNPNANINPGANQYMNQNMNTNVNLGANQYTNPNMNTNVNQGANQYTNPNVNPAANQYANPNMNVAANQYANPNMNNGMYNGAQQVNPGMTPRMNAAQPANPGMTPRMNAAQPANPAMGTRISGFAHRKMEGQGLYTALSVIFSVAIAVAVALIFIKLFPDLYYEKKQVGGKIVKTSTISGGFLVGAIAGAFYGFFYMLFLTLFVSMSGKEANGGSFYLDDLFVNYSIRAISMRKVQAALTINGVNATIANAEEADRNMFLPILKKNDFKSYRKYRIKYFITRIKGRVIRISVDGRTIYFDGTKVVDNRVQVVNMLPPIPGNMF